MSVIEQEDNISVTRGCRLSGHNRNFSVRLRGSLNALSRRRILNRESGNCTRLALIEDPEIIFVEAAHGEPLPIANHRRHKQLIHINMDSEAATMDLRSLRNRRFLQLACGTAPGGG